MKRRAERVNLYGTPLALLDLTVLKKRKRLFSCDVEKEEEDDVMNYTVRRDYHGLLKQLNDTDSSANLVTLLSFSLFEEVDPKFLAAHLLLK